jgi:hypothetical protein
VTDITTIVMGITTIVMGITTVATGTTTVATGVENSYVATGVDDVINAHHYYSSF